MKAAGWVLVFGAIFLLLPAQAYPSYSYVDLHPPGWIESRATCVNGRGDVAGYGLSGSGERGFLLSSGRLTEILPPGATGARAAWVNGRGEVAVTAVIDGRLRAFLYRNGTYLDPTPGWAFSEAAYVGEDGAVTGTGEFGAYISRDGVPEILPGFTVVIGANAAGQLLGSAENTARLYLPGKGYLTLCPPGTSAAVPGGLNESGLAAVSSRQADSENGFVYSGGFYVFMTPPGWSSSNARAINNRSQVVGYGASPEGRRSFLRSGAAYEELSFPGWTTTEAVSLNDLGQVAGSGETVSGEPHAFLASPENVPAAGDGSGTSSIGSAGGGGCSTASARTSRPSPTAWGNLLALFVPILFPLLLNRIGRRRRGSATPR
jgi:uncharacterized membrane protein